MPPKKGDIPGYDPVDDDDKAKGGKRSRRKRKGATTDEAIQAGPSSAVPSPSPAQTGYGSGPSVQSPPTSTEKVQTPAPMGARQPIQIPSRPAQTASSLTQPAQSVAQIGTLQAGQATSLIKPANAAGPTAGLPNRDATGSENLKEDVSASNQPGKEMSGSGGGKQEVARLKGQPRRPDNRPKVNNVDLVSNYFPLEIRPNLVLWHYGIIVEPEIKGPKLTQIIKTALNYGGYRALRPRIVTDFSAVMLSVGEIPAEYRKFKLSYQSELETQPPNNAKEYWISLVEKGSVDLREPNSYLNSTETSSNGLPIEQALDIVLGHHRKLSDDVAIVNKRKAFSINSNLHDQYDDYNLGLRVLTALRGYFSSVRLSQSSILVNINVSHGAFYLADLPLMNVINGLTGLRVDLSKIPGVLRGLRVSSSHISRVWSIWGFPRKGDGIGYMLHPPRLNPPDAPSYTPGQVSFFHEENAQALSEDDKKKAKDGRLRAHDDRCSCPGRWMTVAKYFETVRMEPISIENLKLPVVNVGSNKRPTYLPSHLCTVRRGQISNLKLNSDQSRGMITFAVRDPSENATSIRDKAFNTLGLTSANPELERFGISVSRSMVRLKGRTLTKPTLLYGGGQKPAKVRGSSWSLLGVPFNTSMELNKWACLRIISHPSKDISIHDESLRKCLTDFQKHLRSKGINAEKTDDHGDLRLGGQGFESLEAWFRDSRDTYGVRFLLVVLPDHPTSELYNHIKRYGDLKYGIHTVCVKTKNFGTLPYDDNVALKVNLKLGGKNHVLDEKSYGPFLKDSTMVVGIDVTHPAPGNEGAPSVAAVVASRDRLLTQWPADLRINNRRQEMVEMLREMLETRLEVYKANSQQELPTNILIYRDGVGEGQYKIVLDEELPRLRRACQDVYKKEYQEGVFPRISLIVVGKRHHTRFYATSKDGTVLPGKASNPEPGTLVDSGITQNCNWDFFLQSHTAIKGTARPAHYFVLVDEIFRRNSLENAVRDLEVFTHNLCYLYGKATTSVSIPPPVYYADKACDRGRRYLSRVFDPSQRRGNAPVGDDDVKVNDYLKDTMFYI